jgi:hypothetical protein
LKQRRINGPTIHHPQIFMAAEQNQAMRAGGAVELASG